LQQAAEENNMRHIQPFVKTYVDAQKTQWWNKGTFSTDTRKIHTWLLTF
jgi:hypothetical protein